jgi:hypothetical protein
VVGSLCAWSKADKDNEFSYMTYDGNDMIRHRVPDGYFVQIKEFNLTANEVSDFISERPSINHFDMETFLILNVTCSSEEKVHLDHLIRETYTRNLYELNWVFTDVESDYGGDIESDDSIVSRYFESADEPKRVEELFYEYGKKVVN